MGIDGFTLIATFQRYDGLTLIVTFELNRSYWLTEIKIT